MRQFFNDQQIQAAVLGEKISASIEEIENDEFDSEYDSFDGRLVIEGAYSTDTDQFIGLALSIDEIYNIGLLTTAALPNPVAVVGVDRGSDIADVEWTPIAISNYSAAAVNAAILASGALK